MKFASIIAASVLGTSLALCTASDADPVPAPRPSAAPFSLTAPQAHVPNMTQMPKSYVQGTILFRQNGEPFYVDTSGRPLPNQGMNSKVQSSSASKPPKPGLTPKSHTNGKQISIVTKHT